MDITILYEDNDLVVIDKPAGIVVNKAETTKNMETVQKWAERRLPVTYEVSTIKYGDSEWKPELDFGGRGGVVHRLDKETSGALILAKNPQAFVHLLRQFHERTVKKTYQALAHGRIEPEKGEINAPVGRLPWNSKQFGILPGGKESKTLYQVLQYYQLTKMKEIFSFVELYPQSGRTHQIRVHLKYINHPIFSDFLYAGRKTSRKDREVLERVFLHAAKIAFIQPSSGKEILVESPLPEELRNVLEKLDSPSVSA